MVGTVAAVAAEVAVVDLVVREMEVEVRTTRKRRAIAEGIPPLLRTLKQLHLLRSPRLTKGSKGTQTTSRT